MKITIGIDEAGRGALAGPLVAAAVVFDDQAKQKEFRHCFKDSKLLKPAERKELFSVIINNFPYHIVFLDNQYIDKHGIQKTNVYIVEKLLNELNMAQAIVNCDYIGAADNYRTTACRINFYKKGESRYPEIAAASILAKVYRDNIMIEWDQYYPQYNLAGHKGYGTKVHIEAIKKFGPCPLHRQSFIKNL